MVKGRAISFLFFFFFGKCVPNFYTENDLSSPRAVRCPLSPSSLPNRHRPIFGDAVT